MSKHSCKQDATIEPILSDDRITILNAEMLVWMQLCKVFREVHVHPHIHTPHTLYKHNRNSLAYKKVLHNSLQYSFAQEKKPIASKNYLENDESLPSFNLVCCPPHNCWISSATHNNYRWEEDFPFESTYIRKRHLRKCTLAR